MNGESDDAEPDGAGDATAGFPLRAVSGPLGGEDEPAPAVRLRREFKGLTVPDLLRDEILSRLPGQVRSALQHIERGDLDAAERALPGHFAKVLEGPRRARSGRWGWVVLGAALAITVASWLTTWLFSLAGS